jgi:integrase
MQGKYSDKDIATIEQIKKVIFDIKPKNEIEKRNQALLSFTLLTGARDGAIISLKLRHLDLDKRLLKQDPKDGVNTKNDKYIETYFFPVGEDVEKIVIDWVKYLKEVKFFDGSYPIFPKSSVGIDADNSFINAGISKEHWQTATPLREIFKKAFEDAGLKYYNPHSFRNTLTQLGEKICKNPEEFKAWSQNLGHESPLTTFISYGYISTYRQGDIIINIGKNLDKDDDKIAKILNLLEGKN